MLDRVHNSHCYHCQVSMPSAPGLSVLIAGREEGVCCTGCMAAVQLITALDLQSFYDYREKCAITPQPVPARHLLPAGELAEALTRDGDGRQHLRLVIPDLRCAACVWLLEQVLGRQPGVAQVTVSLAQRRLQVVFVEPASAPGIARVVQDLGYTVIPDLPNAVRQSMTVLKRDLLLRLGLAGLGMMPVMMFALASYMAGPASAQNPASGMDPLYETLLRWASLAIATPVVFYSAGPFHRGAWQALRNRSLSMDLPVSIAILAAWLLSVYSTLTMGSAVYFDTACMFTFFLLIGRYVELLSRVHFQDNEDLLVRLLPPTATRLSGEPAAPAGQSEASIPVRDIALGDLLRVARGERIPADGTVVAGTSSVSEAAFTGESLPSLRIPGSRVLAGAVNHEAELVIRARCSQEDFLITQISRLYEEAAGYRPQWSQLIDRAAGWFIGAVLGLSAASALLWWLAGADDYLVIALTVLVVACPCALSLATPVASTVAATTLRRQGLLIRHGAFLERAARTSMVVFDKTGTLTEASLHIEEVLPLGALDASACLALATALERHSEHPIARAFAADTELVATDPVTVAGGGVEARVHGVLYRIGTAEFAMPSGSEPRQPEGDGLWVLLADTRALAWFRLQDTLRGEAGSIMGALKELGLRTAIFSGDSSAAGRRLAESLAVDLWQTAMSPQQKIDAVRELSKTECVMMIGDGINDAGALATADTSIAVSPRDVVVQHSADATLLNPSLELLPAVLRFALRTRRIIRQNILWSLAYNLSAIPLALLGFLPPWLAAIGMSLSSVLVILNANRLRRMES